MLVRRTSRSRESGNTLLIVAAALVALLGMAGLAIDLVWLYSVRSEAQRAADGAALAGAREFVTTGCTSAAGGCTPGGVHETLATQRAIAVGTQATVAGQIPIVTASDVTFNYPTPQNPTITVRVARDSAHGGPVPLWFMRIFGRTFSDVAASATAEAFNPAGSGIPVGASCVKPWLLPNCDNSHPVAAGDPNANPNCPDPANPGLFAANYVTGSTIAFPSVQGQLVSVKPGDPSSAAAPSKFYPIYLPPGSTPASCPACSNPPGGGGPSSGALYSANIECCNTNTIVCGSHIAQPITGNMVGPTAQGVRCLIHQDPGSGGQDVFDPTNWSITAGSNNPYFLPLTPNIDSSDSIVTVPLYNGQTLCPGASCPSTINVDVVGFLQVFIKGERNPQGTVDVHIMNVIPCGAGSSGGGGGSGGGGAISGGGAGPIPVRLIRP